ncbi:MAG: carboxypeptidase-like regulatory domain-containing protein [Acidobacteriota bacterium]|nr:carboxypeptidase-like regulatory domain-containing protein [Acidobacteriota bacterium]
MERKEFLSKLLNITAMLFLSVIAITQAQAQTNTFSGRATAVNATIGGINATLSDTGPLPPTGGFIRRELMSGNLFGGALTTGALDAITQGAFDQSRSQAIVENLNLTVGGNTFTSVIVAESSQCTCTANGPFCEAGLFGNLLINGVAVAITGQPNQTVNLAGGGTVIINEQIRTGAGNAASLTANGLHVSIPAVIPGTPPVADIIISSAHSDIVCGSAPALVSVSGRVLNSAGRGVYNAIVTLTNSSGEVRSTITNPFGYYRFIGVAVGETYTLRVRSKRYTFTPQVITPNSELNGVNFVANQQ